MENNKEKLEISIITPERIVYHDFADYISVPGSEGVLGVFPRHTPLFTRIVQGEVSIKNDKEYLHLSVAGGFVEIGKNQVTILADSALRSEDLEEEKIIEAKKKAEEKLQQKLSRHEYLAAEAQLRRVLLDLRIAERKKRTLTKVNS